MQLEKSLLKYFTYHMLPDSWHVILCVACGGINNVLAHSRREGEGDGVRQITYLGECEGNITSNMTSILCGGGKR